MIYNKVKNYIKIFSICLILISCSYSFTGGSIPKHLSNISIPIVKDRSGLGEAELSNNFTNTLIQKFIEDNSLLVTGKNNADAFLDCVISSFNDQLNIVTRGEKVSSRKLTISVKVIYKDLVKRKTVFNKVFSDYGIYNPSEGDVIEARREAIKTAVDKICENILLAVVSNW